MQLGRTQYLSKLPEAVIRNGKVVNAEVAALMGKGDGARWWQTAWAQARAVAVAVPVPGAGLGGAVAMRAATGAGAQWSSPRRFRACHPPTARASPRSTCAVRTAPSATC